ncbi:MAG: hypothetical protein EOR42_30245 [Mesorhizobium sp.]|nr:MAG: hypothetical protein EOR42_30245 [Mesorhizobium sp.]
MGATDSGPPGKNIGLQILAVKMPVTDVDESTVVGAELPRSAGKRDGRQPSSEPDHFRVCPTCGQAVDRRACELAQVLVHGRGAQRHELGKHFSPVLRRRSATANGRPKSEIFILEVSRPRPPESSCRYRAA